MLINERNLERIRDYGSINGTKDLYSQDYCDSDFEELRREDIRELVEFEEGSSFDDRRKAVTRALVHHMAYILESRAADAAADADAADAAARAEELDFLKASLKSYLNNLEAEGVISYTVEESRASSSEYISICKDDEEVIRVRISDHLPKDVYFDRQSYNLITEDHAKPCNSGECEHLGYIYHDADELIQVIESKLS